MTDKSIRFVQAFRGIAALLVVLWHASLYLGPYGTGIGAILFEPGSTMGVDLFFLISGFIMSYTTADADGSIRYFCAFLIKRITRIYPLWLAALGIFILVVKYNEIVLSDPAKLKWLLDSVFFLPTADVDGDYPPMFGFPVLSVGWTLNYEMYFYLFFGACMLFGRWRWVAMGAWLLLTLLAIPYLTGRLAVGGWTTWLFPGAGPHYDSRTVSMITNPLNLLFIAGVMIGQLYRSKFVIENLFYVRLAMFITVALAVWQYMYPFRTEHGIIHWGLSLIPLITVFCIASKRMEIPIANWLVFVGDISFSLYLLHPTIMGLLYYLSRISGLEKIATGCSAIVLCTAMSIAVAAVSYRYMERGLCDYLKHSLLTLLTADRGSRIKRAMNVTEEARLLDEQIEEHQIARLPAFTRAHRLR